MATGWFTAALVGLIVVVVLIIIFLAGVVKGGRAVLGYLLGAGLMMVTIMAAEYGKNDNDDDDETDSEWISVEQEM